MFIIINGFHIYMQMQSMYVYSLRTISLLLCQQKLWQLIQFIDAFIKIYQKALLFLFYKVFPKKEFLSGFYFWLLFLPIPCYKVWFHFSISTKENSITKLTWNVKVPQRRRTWLSTSELTKHGLQCPKCLLCSLRKYSQFIMKQMILNQF